MLNTNMFEEKKFFSQPFNTNQIAMGSRTRSKGVDSPGRIHLRKAPSNINKRKYNHTACLSCKFSLTAFLVIINGTSLCVVKVEKLFSSPINIKYSFLTIFPDKIWKYGCS